jgi:hypothetical protein
MLTTITTIRRTAAAAALALAVAGSGAAAAQADTAAPQPKVSKQDVTRIFTRGGLIPRGAVAPKSGRGLQSRAGRIVAAAHDSTARNSQGRTHKQSRNRALGCIYFNDAAICGWDTYFDVYYEIYWYSGGATVGWMSSAWWNSLVYFYG